MEWIEPNEINWRKLLDEDRVVVAVIHRGEIKDVICGRVSMMNNRNELEVENSQGRIGFDDYEVEKILILEF